MVSLFALVPLALADVDSRPSLHVWAWEGIGLYGEAIGIQQLLALVETSCAQADKRCTVHYLSAIDRPFDELAATARATYHTCENGSNVCYNTLVLLGFSVGGDAAIEASWSLAAETDPICVDLLQTQDPFPHNPWKGFVAPTNVALEVNHFQRAGLIRGSPVKGVVNQQIDKSELSSTGLGFMNAHRSFNDLERPKQALVEALANVDDERPSLSCTSR